MRCGDLNYDAIKKLGKKYEDLLKEDEEKLWKGMYNLMNWNSIINKISIVSDLMIDDDGIDNLNALVDHFKANLGTMYRSDYMDEQLRKHPRLEEFMYHERKGVMRVLKDNLKKAHGDLNKVKLQTDIKKEIHIVFNRKYEDYLNGMVLAVDNTSAYKIFIYDYELTSSNKFSCRLRIEIYDHFGLDVRDVQKFENFPVKGFLQWYILQHYKKYAYKPFLTLLTAYYELKDENFED